MGGPQVAEQRGPEVLLAREGHGFGSGVAGGSSSEIRTTTRSGWEACKRRAVSTPSIPGMRTSTSTSCGFAASTSRSASSPDAASPADSKPAVASITSREADRNTA